VRITVNGDAVDVDDGIALPALLLLRGWSGDRVAVERNGKIVRRVDRAGVTLLERDVLEVVTLVGGG
jgi:thiamine biosynthesis protein ThiS